MRKDLLLKLANYLENHVEDKWFDMGTWGSAGFLDHECGSVGCAIGYQCTAFPEDGLKLVKGMQDSAVIYFPHNENTNSYQFKAVADLYEISSLEAKFLFYRDRYDDLCPSRSDVINRIRNFCNRSIS